jgi:cell division septal protein FtsQ
MPSRLCAWTNADYSLFAGQRKRIRLSCARGIDIDTSYVNSPQQPAEKPRSSQVPRIAVVLMIIIVTSLAVVAIFANIQRLRRGQIETIVVVPADSTTPQPR